MLFNAASRLVSAAFWFGAAARVLAAVSFCAATVCDALVTVDKLAAFSAAALASAAAMASAAVPVLYDLPFHSNVALGPNAKRLAANASLNVNGLVVVAAFLSIAPCKSPNSVSTTGVVTAGVVTVLRAPVPVVFVAVAPVSTTGVVTAVLSAPVPMLLTPCIASSVACVLASTPLKVTPFPASVVTLLLTLANCKPLGVVLAPVASVPTVLSAPVLPVVSVAASVLVRLVAPVVPAVTTSEFCNAVTALLAVAVLEPVALAYAFAAAATFPPVVVKVAAAAPNAASPVCAVIVVPTTEPRTAVPTLSVLPVTTALVTTVAALLTTFCKNGSSTTPDKALSTSLFTIDEAPPVNCDLIVLSTILLSGTPCATCKVACAIAVPVAVDTPSDAAISAPTTGRKYAMANPAIGFDAISLSAPLSDVSTSCVTPVLSNVPSALYC